MNHSKWKAAAAGLCALAALGACGAIAKEAPVANVALSPLWDDGKAEFDVYSGTTERYGETRPTTVHLIVVKEDLLRASLVKSDRGPVAGKTLEVLKLNFVADFPTGTYSYHQMATVMLARTSLDVLKESMSHTESCGITYVRVGPKHGRLVHEAHSYWDGEADRETPVVWPAGERLWWDALPVSLRRWVAGGATPFEISVWVLPSQVSGRAPLESTRPIRATLRMKAAGEVQVPAGRFRARAFELETPAGVDRFWFDERFPHPMLRMETAAGRRLALEKTMRLDYWKHHANGDERLLARER